VIRRLVAVALGVALLSGCVGNDAEEVRPLIDLEGVELAVTRYDDASLQQRLESLVAQAAKIAKAEGGWGRIGSDVLNPEIMDMVFVGGARSTIGYGYGDTATSVLSRDDHTIFAMAGDSGSCWGVRVSGSYTEPQVLRGNFFAPDCSASKLADHALLPCSTRRTCTAAELEEAAGRVWLSTWPAPALPTATGPEGIEVGEAPSQGG